MDPWHPVQYLIFVINEEIAAHYINVPFIIIFICLPLLIQWPCNTVKHSLSPALEMGCRRKLSNSLYVVCIHDMWIILIHYLQNNGLHCTNECKEANALLHLQLLLLGHYKVQYLHQHPAQVEIAHSGCVDID